MAEVQMLRFTIYLQELFKTQEVENRTPISKESNWKLQEVQQIAVSSRRKFLYLIWQWMYKLKDARSVNKCLNDVGMSAFFFCSRTCQ